MSVATAKHGHAQSAAGGGKARENTPVMTMAARWPLLLAQRGGGGSSPLGEAASAGGWGLSRGDCCSISAGISTEEPQTGEVQHRGSCRGWLRGRGGGQGAHWRRALGNDA